MLKKLNLTNRDHKELHRTATPLELMFDLAAVIAVAAAVHGLHHSIVSEHSIDGIWGFAFAFFMIWIAWTNYTWLASGYDNGSRLFQGLSMVIMFGFLVLASGIPAVFSGESLMLPLIGFIIMRVSLIICWLAVAKADVKRRGAAYRYAVGLSVSQMAWIGAVLMIPPTSSMMKVAFISGLIFELCIPIFAEKNIKINFHREHLIERHGLLFIIVLGEGFLASVLVLKTGITEGANLLTPLLISALIATVVFGLWYLYFNDQEKYLDNESSSRRALFWGYLHFPLLMVVAAVGTGLALLAENIIHDTEKLKLASSLAVAIPISLYYLCLWLIRDTRTTVKNNNWVFPLGALLILGCGFPGGLSSLIGITLILLLSIVLQDRKIY